jgi:hypothetical protein
MSLNRPLCALSVLIAALFMAGCGGGSKSPQASGTPSSTSATSTSATSTSATSTPSSALPATTAATTAASSATQPPSSAHSSVASVGGNCGNATVAVNKATNASPESDQVLDIELKGGCAAVTLATVLPSGDSTASATALKICQTAATPAYANGVGAVSVLGVGGSELAAGTKGSACVQKG